MLSVEKLKLMHKGIILISVPLVFELAFVITLTALLQKADYEAWRQSHSRVIVSEVNKLSLLVYKAGENLLSFSIYRSPEALAKFDQTLKEFNNQLDLIEKFAIDDPNRLQSTENLDQFANASLDILRRARSMLQGERGGAALPAYVSTKSVLERNINGLLDAINDYVDRERQIENIDPAAEGRARAMVTTCIIVGIAFNIALALALAVFFSKEISHRLATVVENTERLSQERELKVPLSGADEISHLDRAFHQMAETLDELSKRKQEILDMVSHDLRSPMTSVSVALSLVLKGVCGDMAPRVADEVALAQRNVKRLLKLIDDLLDFEKMKAGKLELNISSVAISQLFERSAEVISAIAEKQGVTIKVSADDITMDADEERLIQVLVNLLSNAVKYSPKGGIVGLSAQKDSQSVTLQVSDQGRGIPPEYKDSIFEPFKQVKGTKQAGSTGLGLTISKNIVEQHGGTIGVDSEVGLGSTFWIRLPLVCEIGTQPAKNV
jgi:signal transduction histidine kinase